MTAPHSQSKVAIPEHKQLRADAKREVEEELSGIARAHHRFARASEIVQQADLEIAAHVEERNQAAVSLWLYEGVRGVARVLGVYPNAFYEMYRLALFGDKKANVSHDGDLVSRMSAAERRQAAEDAGVPFIEDAAERLPGLSETVSVATARRQAAMPFLQDAALELSEEPCSWEVERIAKLGNVTTKYVRDLKFKAKRRSR
ncbi:hypothetical protein ACIQU6_28070 [Streptomyces sp. NPDC090442]|uniref:hypothetical protein n=1 Tax=Streptomyces sp. NPDC090442 TaxID=3365962 RepID=UPI0038160645